MDNLDEAKRHTSGWGDRPMLGGTPSRAFTKRHHKVIAEVINDFMNDTLDPGVQPNAAALTIRALVERFARVLRRDNPAFDDATFVDACLKGWW